MMENKEQSSKHTSSNIHPDVELREMSRSTINIDNAQDTPDTDGNLETNVEIHPKFERHSERSIFFNIYGINCFTSKCAVLGFLFYIILVTIVGTLIVCFTLQRARILCQVTVKQVTENSMINNSHPLSVAVSHLNNDSWLDIVVANSGTDSIAIFLGYGNGSFSTATMYSTGIMSRPISVTVTDMNNDHWMDIIVANYDSHNVSVLFGHGDGTFTNKFEFSLGSSRPLSVTVGDLNNDTWLDIVVSNNGIYSIGVLLGNENGSFQMPVTYSTGYDSIPYSVIIADLNNDHRPDVAVANFGTDNIGVFLGYGNGTFAAQVTFSTGHGSGPRSITIADCNNDRRLDIIVANYHSDTVGIFLGYGNGNFARQKTYFLGSGFHPCGVAMGYINQDNQLDIVVSNNGSDSVSVLIGYRNGIFEAPTTHLFTAGSNPSGIAVGDFDNDNQSDVVVSNSIANNIIIVIKYTTILSENPTTYPIGNDSISFALGISDLNNDNNLDIVTANYGTNSIGILLGYGNGSFGKVTNFDNGNASRPDELGIGDFNNDGFPDIAVANFNANYTSLLLGYGNGSFALVKSFVYQEMSSITSVAVGDFNGDQKLDIVLSDFGHEIIMILLGHGNGSFEQAGSYPTGNGSRPTFVEVGDFNNDEHLDIACANYGLNNVGIFLGYGNGTFTSQTIYFTGNSATTAYISVGDINNDNCSDLAVANSGTNNIGVLFGFCNGTFATQIILESGPGSTPYSVVISDVNSDQWMDLVVANQGLDNVGIFLGYGNGSFTNQFTFSSGPYSLPYGAVVGDLNNDKRMDVATINHATNNVAILLGHPNIGTKITDAFLLGDYYSDFENQFLYSTGSNLRPYSIAVGDFNNDTQLDIVVSNSGTENIGIFLGRGNGLFSSGTTYSLGSNSRPQNVIVRDFNRDDRLDVVVSNLLGDSISTFLGYGNGSFAEQLVIRTDPGSNPNSIATGDLNSDGRLDLVVMNTGSDTINFFFGFQYLSFQHAIRSTTGDHTGTASIVTGDFNNDGRVDIATSNYNSDNIGILLGYGNGSFAPPVMYVNLTGSHPWAVAVADFNSDGKPDITVTIWGLNQIGVLLGNGDGTFEEPLIYFAGSATRPVAITVGDFNNDNHVDIATANYGTGTVSVILGYGNGTFRDVIQFSTEDSSGPSSINVADLNKDNHLDIIVANEITYNVGVLYGNGDGTFRNITTYLTKPNTSPQYALSGDFNNDSLPDIAVAMFGSGDIGVFLGYGNEIFSPITLYSGGFDSGSQYLALNDLNYDNYVDIVVANVNTGAVGILFGNGDGTFKSIVSYYMNPGTSIYSVAIADFNNDTIADIVFTDYSTDEVGVLFRNGFKPFGGYTPLPYVNGSNPSSVAVGDLNNDTYLDIAIANFGRDSVGILLGHGDGTFEDVAIYSTGINSGPLSIALGDFNNDTLLDIAVANSNTDDIGIFLGSANGIFTNFRTYSSGIVSNPMSVAVGDLNDDGALDLVVANAGTNNVGIFIGYGNGSFTQQISYPMGYDSRPKYVVLGNFNNDNWIDIAVTNYGADNVKILLNCPAV